MVQIYECEELPIDGAAKGRAGTVVVLLRPGLSAGRRRQVLKQLLTPRELQEVAGQDGGPGDA